MQLQMQSLALGQSTAVPLVLQPPVSCGVPGQEEWPLPKRKRSQGDNELHLSDLLRTMLTCELASTRHSKLAKSAHCCRRQAWSVQGHATVTLMQSRLYADRLERLGMTAMPPATGLAALSHILRPSTMYSQARLQLLRLSFCHWTSVRICLP